MPHFSTETKVCVKIFHVFCPSRRCRYAVDTFTATTSWLGFCCYHVQIRGAFLNWKLHYLPTLFMKEPRATMLIIRLQIFLFRHEFRCETGANGLGLWFIIAHDSKTRQMLAEMIYG